MRTRSSNDLASGLLDHGARIVASTFPMIGLGGSLVAFLGVSIAVIVSPGPDTALTVRSTLAGGRSAGVFTALGVTAGQLIWAIASSAGVVALLLASGPLFQLVKLAGAAYLVGLGVHALVAACRSGGTDVARPGDAPAGGPLRPVVAFRQGVINNLGNPKMAAFFASLLPQFASPGEDGLGALLLLAAIFSSMTLAWLALCAVAVSALGGAMRRPAVRRATEAAAAAALIGLGARLATERP